MPNTLFVDSRCVMKHFAEYLLTLKPKMRDSHRLLLARTPFYRLLDTPDLVQQRILLGLLVQHFDPKDGGFWIGGEKKFFKPEDVAVLTGLSVNGKTISFDHGVGSALELSVIRSRGLKLVTRKDLQGILDIMVGFSGVMEESNFVKMVLVYVFSILLFPNSALTVPGFVYRYCDKLEEMHMYSWARAIHKYMFGNGSTSFCEAHKKVDDFNAGTRGAGYIRGFVPLVLIWFFKLTNSAEPSVYGTEPELLGWGGVKYRESGGFTKYFLPVGQGSELRAGAVMSPNTLQDIQPTESKRRYLTRQATHHAPETKKTRVLPTDAVC